MTKINLFLLFGNLVLTWLNGSTEYFLFSSLPFSDKKISSIPLLQCITYNYLLIQNIFLQLAFPVSSLVISHHHRAKKKKEHTHKFRIPFSYIPFKNFNKENICLIRTMYFSLLLSQLHPIFF